MPDLRGEYLSGRDARLPEDANGRVTLVMMGFTYASRKPVEAWAGRVRPAFAALDRATFYEVPVIGGMARMGKWFIDSGMRRGTPKALHENVITVWGQTDAWKARLGVTNATDEQAWLVLLDREGRVRWLYAGGLSDEAFTALMSAARAAQ